MPDGSRSSDRQMQLEAEHLRLSELLNRLQEVIGELERAPFLNADAAARLDKYRQNLTRRQFDRRQLESAIQELHGTTSTIGCRRCTTRCSSACGRTRRERLRLRFVSSANLKSDCKVEGYDADPAIPPPEQGSCWFRPVSASGGKTLLTGRNKEAGIPYPSHDPGGRGSTDPAGKPASPSPRPIPHDQVNSRHTSRSTQRTGSPVIVRCAAATAWLCGTRCLGWAVDEDGQDLVRSSTDSASSFAWCS